MAPEVAGEQFSLKRRAKVLWYFQDTVANVNTGDELAVTAPARARTGRAFTVTVSAYTASGARSAAAGARVAWNGGSATTDATGRASVTVARGGELRLRATRGADIPSAVQRTCVARRLSGCSPVRGLRLTGTAKADSLKGSAGPDAISAGGGSDRVDVRRGRADVIRCGSGRDRVRMSRDDKACPRLRGRDPRGQEGPRLGMARPGRRLRPALAALAAIGFAGGAWAAPATAAPRAPVVEQIVVFKSGKARQGKVRASGTTRAGRSPPVRRGHRHAAGSSVAIEARVGGAARLRRLFAAARLELGAALRALGPRRPRARARRLGLQGRPPARHRRRGRHLGAVRARSPARRCAGSLGSTACSRAGAASARSTLKAEATAAVSWRCTVRGYDDEGRGVAVGGATRSGRRCERGDSDATARRRLTLRPGRHTLAASKAGLVRSFGERVTVR